MAEPAPVIAIKRFWTTYERAVYHDEFGKVRPPQDGELPMRAVDWAEFGSPGSLDRLANVEKISRLSRVHDIADAAGNPAVQLANWRWDQIRPLYENWKKGHAPTADGTPLAAWNRLQPEQAEYLRIQGVSTIEQLSTLGDAHIQRLQIPGLRDLIADSRRFLAAGDTARVEMDLRAKDEEISALKAQMEELADIVRSQMASAAEASEDDEAAAPVRRGPGRPPKVRDEAA